MRELEDARYKAIGARIRDVRIEKNMSQAELAEKAFISVPHMSEVENGKTKLRLSTFVYITEALQVSADVLLRPNTPEVNGIYQGEFKDLLADCSPAEIDSIIKIVKELKTTIVLHDFSKSTGYINRLYIQVCCNISVYDFDMNFTFIEESVQNYA